MSSAFPPPEHNPHEWAVVGPRHEEFVNEEGNPVVHDVMPSPVPEQAEAEWVGEPGPELELPDGSDQDDGDDEPEGGERPSAETTESAGTDSSESSSPDRKSTTSGAKPTRKPARNAGNR